MSADEPNQSASNSSDSSSNSNRTLTHDSTSSSSDSGDSIGGTIIIVQPTRMATNSLINTISTDILGTNISSMDTDDATTTTTTISSNESVRQYKNSPFGLNRHYLTMPDPIGTELHDYRSEANKIGETNEKVKGAQTRRDWKKSGVKTKSSSSNERNNRRYGRRESKMNDLYDLSILQPVSNSQSSMSSPNWRDSEHERQLRTNNNTDQGSHRMNKNETNVLTSLNNYATNSNDAHVNRLSPAFDAGLDAKKCNSKQANDNFCNLNDTNSSGNQFGLKIGNIPAQDYDCLLVRFSSVMYATFLVILGCILHCSELRQKSRNSSDHIYTTIVALIGISWLLFLQGDLQRYKRYASKYILIESIFNDHKQRVREMNHSLAPLAHSISSSSASLANDRMSMNTEVIFKKTAYKMYQRRAEALSRHDEIDRSDANHSSPTKFTSRAQLNYSDPFLKASGRYNVNQNYEKQMKSNPELIIDHELDNLVPAYKFLHGKMGANFYLKCGMAAFCFGHVIHEGLRFGQQLYFFGTGNVHCRDLAALIAHLVTPLYSFYQLFMMFKYSNLVINRHRVLAKFGLMHIVGTSITFWFRTILEEAYEDFVHKMDYFKTNKTHSSVSLVNISSLNDPNLVAALNSLSGSIITEASERSEQSAFDQNVTVAKSIWALMSSPISATITPQIARHLPESYACAQNTLLTTKSMNALPYLYPFTIEYNLLLAATFLSLYFNIGKIGHSGAGCKPFTTHSLDLGKETSRPRGSFTSSPISNIESSENLTALKNERKDTGEYKSNFVVNADCHSANKGLFCGFFVLLVTLVTIVIFFVTINKSTHVQLGVKINLIQEGVLTALLLIVALAGIRQLSKLNRSPYMRDKVTTDDVLMLIPLPFFFFHSLLSFRAEFASLYRIDLGSSVMSQRQFAQDPLKIHSITISTSKVVNNTQIKSRSSTHLGNSLLGNHNLSNSELVENFINDTSGNTDISGYDHYNRKGKGSSNIDAGNDSSQIDHFKLITVALNIIVMIEVLVQTNFIIDGMRRCSESRYLRYKKPGRELITFAILLNITYWIVATFETKSVEQYKPEIEYYGPLPYMFISHTTLPVMLFYRYHSSVCLAEIWNRAYKPPKRR